jgi:hypothetical protein
VILVRPRLGEGERPSIASLHGGAGVEGSVICCYGMARLTGVGRSELGTCANGDRVGRIRPGLRATGAAGPGLDDSHLPGRGRGRRSSPVAASVPTLATCAFVVGEAAGGAEPLEPHAATTTHRCRWVTATISQAAGGASSSGSSTGATSRTRTDRISATASTRPTPASTAPAAYAD